MEISLIAITLAAPLPFHTSPDRRQTNEHFPR